MTTEPALPSYPSSSTSVVLLLFILPSVLFFHSVNGILCYKCRTLTSSRIRRSVEEFGCDNFAAASISDKDAMFVVDCFDGCSFAVDIPETVNASGVPFRLGLELRDCFNKSLGMKMGACLESVPFLDIFREDGQKLLDEKMLTTPTMGSMKFCGCDVDHCNFDMNKAIYFPAHVKQKAKEAEERERHDREAAELNSGSIRWMGIQIVREGWVWLMGVWFFLSFMGFGI